MDFTPAVPEILWFSMGSKGKVGRYSQSATAIRASRTPWFELSGAICVFGGRRFDVRGLCLALLGVIALMGTVLAPVSAQGVDSAFSDKIIKTLGYPEVNVEVLEEEVKAPSTLTEGYYLFTLSTYGENIAYLDIVQPPAGLTEEEEVQLMRDAGINDLAQPDWVYVGGTNTPDPGLTASFIVYLKAGDYKLGASYYGTEEGAEEILRMVPLTVTAADATASPVATTEPTSTVTLEETDDLRYIVSPDSIPAGPQIWKIANTGMHHAHHVVMVRIPEGVTSEQIVAEFGTMMSGTPAAGPSVFEQFIWTGYAALQSGGQTTWAEFDLKPGHYAAICFIIDLATEMPHAVNGMVTTFDVE
jgi:hypothetical protein